MRIDRSRKEGDPMENESISIDRRILASLMRLKQPSETVSDLFGRLLEQIEKQSLLDEQHRRLERLSRLYLPENAISDYVHNPSSLMISQNRPLAIMFTDIRSFSSLSGGRLPEDIVQELNRYFRIMADIIYSKNGIIDKYIGDSIMAYFGYPTHDEKTALQAVLAGIEMLESSKIELPSYHSAIGINYGVVTIGNVGHPNRKLDFTIIGDMVNLASRMESLTSTYKQEILITESVCDKIKDVLPHRLVDTLFVGDMAKSIKIFTTKKDLSQKEQAAWNEHNRGMIHFYENDFKDASQCFRKVLEFQESDHLAKMMIERCTKGLQK
jgi:adenylate cyclase